MKAVFKLINAYYWKGFFGPFFTLFWPFLIFFLLGNVTYSNALTSLEKNNLSSEIIEKNILNLAKSIIVGVLISTIISNGLIGFSTIIVDFKKSTLIKRIGSANIQKSHFMLASLFYQFVWTLFVIIWVPLVGTLVLGFNKYLNFSIGFNLGLIYILPWIMLLFLVSVSMGLLIISLVNSTIGASTIANLVFFPISFLSGGFGNGKPNLNYAPLIHFFTYIIPTKYVSDPLFVVFEEEKYSSLYSIMGWQSYGFPILSIVLSLIFIFISIKKFKWGE
ncbi:ABC transporter permease [Mesomycoplasma molare]|uniref:ABC transporter permease n=1 Tax=Mesomycoplasma molare TaxID=171288 RepID=A0ABY5TUE5_9BACT|nr:ABC transporter permease [Mesomycoplasma molare]UWD34282.1 ABC transporter permease [Mesomycoplasma molare]